LIGIELEDVANQQDKNPDEEKEAKEGEADEAEGLERGVGVEEVQIEGVESSQRKEER
jgi:hypothetical protein